MSEAEESKAQNSEKECFMMGYLVGLTTNERVPDDRMLEMFGQNNVPQIQVLVRLIQEQLSDGLIEKDEAVKFLGKKFLEFAKKNNFLENGK